MSDSPDPIALLQGSDDLPTAGSALEAFCGCAEPLDEVLMMTTGIVVAFVGSSRQMPEGGLPALIASTYAALADLEGTSRAKQAADAP